MAIQRSERFEGEEKEAKREFQVHEWLERAKKEVSRAEVTQTQVEDRLGPVLRSGECSIETEVVAEEVVPVANAIREIVWRVTRISDQYKDMLGRLEL